MTQKSMKANAGHARNLQLLKDITRHMQFSRYRIVFAVCQDPSCDWTQCTTARSPKFTPRAPKWNEMLKVFGGVLPGPVPSADYPGHYLTFLEMLKLAKEGASFPPPDHYCPSSQTLPTPRICTRSDKCGPLYTIVSKTDGARHDKLLHQNERTRTLQLPSVREVYRDRKSTV